MLANELARSICSRNELSSGSYCFCRLLVGNNEINSRVAQLVVHPAVNRVVAGSSPAPGAFSQRRCNISVPVSPQVRVYSSCSRGHSNNYIITHYMEKYLTGEWGVNGRPSICEGLPVPKLGGHQMCNECKPKEEGCLNSIWFDLGDDRVHMNLCELIHHVSPYNRASDEHTWKEIIEAIIKYLKDHDPHKEKQFRVELPSEKIFVRGLENYGFGHGERLYREFEKKKKDTSYETDHLCSGDCRKCFMNYSVKKHDNSLCDEKYCKLIDLGKFYEAEIIWRTIANKDLCGLRVHTEYGWGTITVKVKGGRLLYGDGSSSPMEYENKEVDDISKVSPGRTIEDFKRLYTYERDREIAFEEIGIDYDETAFARTEDGLRWIAIGNNSIRAFYLWLSRNNTKQWLVDFAQRVLDFEMSLRWTKDEMVERLVNKDKRTKRFELYDLTNLTPELLDDLKETCEEYLEQRGDANSMQSSFCERSVKDKGSDWDDDSCQSCPIQDLELKDKVEGYGDCACELFQRYHKPIPSDWLFKDILKQIEEIVSVNGQAWRTTEVHDELEDGYHLSTGASNPRDAWKTLSGLRLKKEISKRGFGYIDSNTEEYHQRLLCDDKQAFWDYLYKRYPISASSALIEQVAKECLDEREPKFSAAGNTLGYIKACKEADTLAVRAKIFLGDKSEEKEEENTVFKGMEKMFKENMFKEVNNVVLDLTSGLVGIKDGDNIVTLREIDGKLQPVQAAFDLSYEIPAFAMRIPVDQLHEGDIFLHGKTGIPTFFTELTKDGRVGGIGTGGEKRTMHPVLNMWFGGNCVMAVKNMMNMMQGGNAGGMFGMCPGGGHGKGHGMGGGMGGGMGMMGQMMMMNAMFGDGESPFDFESGGVRDKRGAGKMVSMMMMMQMFGGGMPMMPMMGMQQPQTEAPEKE